MTGWRRRPDPGAGPDIPTHLVETAYVRVISADRLSQMTKAYNDIDAVTRLLEEKERDLELAARIGQSLLDQNKTLRQKNDQLEQELSSCNDEVTQLKHDLSIKTGLLQLYTQDMESDSAESATSPTLKERVVVNWEVLNKKIEHLQDENVQLRTEAINRYTDLENEEKKEMKLINDCVKQLAELNTLVSTLQEELAKKTEEGIAQQEEITQLLTQVVELQRKLREVTNENEMLQDRMEVCAECQKELTEELVELKARYSELLAALQELQEEARKEDSSGAEFPESLAFELQGFSLSPKVPQRNLPKMEKVSAIPSSMQNGLNCLSRSASEQYNGDSSSAAPSDTESAYEGSCQTDDEDSTLHSLKPKKTGRLRRYSSGMGTDDSHSTPRRSWTPDCFIQSGRLQPHAMRVHDKLQLIKPMEGSQTLQRWQLLATPHLEGLFESRPGVHAKIDVAVIKERLQRERRNSLSASRPPSIPLSSTAAVSGAKPPSPSAIDPPVGHQPGKRFDGTSSIYTFTNSSHHFSKDDTVLTPSGGCSYPGVQVASRHNGGETPNLGQPPREPSLLTSQIISATPTPAPSPEGSPPHTPPSAIPSAFSSLLESTQRLCRSLQGGLKSPSKASRGTNTAHWLEVDSAPTTMVGIEALVAAQRTRASIISRVHCDLSSPKSSLPQGESASSPLKLEIPLSTSDKHLPKVNLHSPATPLTPSKSHPLTHPWGYVPPNVRPPLSLMPNPMLQLRSLSPTRPPSPAEIGVIRPQRTLRKGGYI